MHILVINCGSSSIKFSLYNIQKQRLLLSGKIESIGSNNASNLYKKYSVNGEVQVFQDSTAISDHAAGLKQVFSFLKKNIPIDSLHSLNAIGHRVVHGGEVYKNPALINSEVMDDIKKMIPFAPLHNPLNLIAINTIKQHYPQVPQVAVFDTAFFQQLPAYAYRYALPENLYKQHLIRRYGFHGISHQQVTRQAAVFLQQPIESLRLISLHLGNGASAAAINKGTCIDTSMGMTPLEGLIMGTRSGDLDPSVPSYLARALNINLDEVEYLLNHESGMKGLCGANDMREVHKLVAKGNIQAQLAIEMYCYRISKYIGAYFVALGGLDALVFTGGVGENDCIIRQSVCHQLTCLGVMLDDKKNQKNNKETYEISKDKSKVKILVVPANEELEIAHQTVSAINKTGATG